MISLKTYERIQSKLETSPQYLVKQIEINENRVDRSDDFPLRGFLYCETSKQMISGAWSQGKRSKFPYYTYPRKSPLFGKSINRDRFHEEFQKHLEVIQPKEDVLEAFEKAVKNALSESKRDGYKAKERMQKEIKSIEFQIAKYMQRISKAKSELLIENYEKQIEDLEKKKLQISKKTTKRV